MKTFLNIIYYFSYKLSIVISRKLDRLTFFLLTPFKWIAFNTPFIRNRYIRLCGSLENAEKEIKKAYNYVSYNKEWGFTTQYALAFYGSPIMLYFWGAYYFFGHYFKILMRFAAGNNIIFLFIVCVALTYIITHYATFKKDVYKKHFKELDKIKGWKRFAYKVMTFVFVIGGFIFWGWAMDFGHH